MLESHKIVGPPIKSGPQFGTLDVVKPLEWNMFGPGAVDAVHFQQEEGGGETYDPCTLGPWFLGNLGLTCVMLEVRKI